MTNKEAKRILYVFRAVILVDESHIEAFDMAIKALEQEPCEDCISRRAVLDGLASIAKVKAKSDAQKSLMGRVMFFTEHLPSVTPQSKTGRWIEQIDHEENCRTLICSNCDRPALHDGDSIWKHKFCPNCGAKMVELQESEVIKNADGNN